MKHKPQPIILGIDPGFGRVGWGIVQKTARQLIPCAYGCIETHKQQSFVDRLLTIEQELIAIIEEYHPTLVGIESLFFHTNTTTAMNVSHARGVMLLTCHKHGIPCHDITPLQVKQGLTGYGKADKQQMQTMVKMQLGLTSIPKPDDAADALAVAIVTASFLAL